MPFENLSKNLDELKAWRLKAKYGDSSLRSE
jgi:hypothetical protein